MRPSLVPDGATLVLLSPSPLPAPRIPWSFYLLDHLSTSTLAYQKTNLHTDDACSNQIQAFRIRRHSPFARWGTDKIGRVHGMAVDARWGPAGGVLSLSRVWWGGISVDP